MITRRNPPVKNEQWRSEFDRRIATTAGLSPEQAKLATDPILGAYLYAYCSGRLPGQDVIRKLLFEMLFGIGPKELLKLSEDLIEAARKMERALENTSLLEVPHAPNLGLPSELCLPLLPKHLRRCGATLLQVKLLERICRRLLPTRKLTESRLLALLCAKVEHHTNKVNYGLIQALLEAGYAAHGTATEKDAEAVRKRLDRFKTKHPDEWEDMQRTFASNLVPDPAFVFGKSVVSIKSASDE